MIAVLTSDTLRSAEAALQEGTFGLFDKESSTVFFEVRSSSGTHCAGWLGVGGRLCSIAPTVSLPTRSSPPAPAPHALDTPHPHPHTPSTAPSPPPHTPPMQVQTQLTNHVMAMLPAAVCGVVCGLAAILFTLMNLKV